MRPSIRPPIVRGLQQQEQPQAQARGAAANMNYGEGLEAPWPGASSEEIRAHWGLCKEAPPESLGTVAAHRLLECGTVPVVAHEIDPSALAEAFVPPLPAGPPVQVGEPPYIVECRNLLRRLAGGPEAGSNGLVLKTMALGSGPQRSLRWFLTRRLFRDTNTFSEDTTQLLYFMASLIAVASRQDKPAEVSAFLGKLRTMSQFDLAGGNGLFVSNEDDTQLTIDAALEPFLDTAIPPEFLQLFRTLVNQRTSEARDLIANCLCLELLYTSELFSKMDMRSFMSRLSAKLQGSEFLLQKEELLYQRHVALLKAAGEEGDDALFTRLERVMVTEESVAWTGEEEQQRRPANINVAVLDAAQAANATADGLAWTAKSLTEALIAIARRDPAALAAPGNQRIVRDFARFTEYLRSVDRQEMIRLVQDVRLFVTDHAENSRNLAAWDTAPAASKVLLVAYNACSLANSAVQGVAHIRARAKEYREMRQLASDMRLMEEGRQARAKAAAAEATARDAARYNAEAAAANRVAKENNTAYKKATNTWLAAKASHNAAENARLETSSADAARRTKLDEAAHQRNLETHGRAVLEDQAAQAEKAKAMKQSFEEHMRTWATQQESGVVLEAEVLAALEFGEKLVWAEEQMNLLKSDGDGAVKRMEFNRDAACDITGTSATCKPGWLGGTDRDPLIKNAQGIVDGRYAAAAAQLAKTRGAWQSLMDTLRGGGGGGALESIDAALSDAADGLQESLSALAHGVLVTDTLPFQMAASAGAQNAYLGQNVNTHLTNHGSTHNAWHTAALNDAEGRVKTTVEVLVTAASVAQSAAEMLKPGGPAGPAGPGGPGGPAGGPRAPRGGPRAAPGAPRAPGGPKIRMRVHPEVRALNLPKTSATYGLHKGQPLRRFHESFDKMGRRIGAAAVKEARPQIISDIAGSTLAKHDVVGGLADRVSGSSAAQRIALSGAKGAATGATSGAVIGGITGGIAAASATAGVGAAAGAASGATAGGLAGAQVGGAVAATATAAQIGVENWMLGTFEDRGAALETGVSHTLRPGTKVTVNGAKWGTPFVRLHEAPAPPDVGGPSPLETGAERLSAIQPHLYNSSKMQVPLEPLPARPVPVLRSNHMSGLKQPAPAAPYGVQPPVPPVRSAPAPAKSYTYRNFMESAPAASNRRPVSGPSVNLPPLVDPRLAAGLLAGTTAGVALSARKMGALYNANRRSRAKAQKRPDNGANTRRAEPTVAVPAVAAPAPAVVAPVQARLSRMPGPPPPPVLGSRRGGGLKKYTVKRRKFRNIISKKNTYKFTKQHGGSPESDNAVAEYYIQMYTTFEQMPDIAISRHKLILLSELVNILWD